MDEQGLILEPGSPKPDAGIGKCIAARLGLHAPDAIARVRYGGGILLERAPAALVESIAAELRDLGVRARAVPPQMLEGLSRGRRSTRLEVQEEACYARLSTGEDLVILRRDLRAVNLHALPVAAAPPPEEGRLRRRGGKKPAAGAEDRLRRSLEPHLAETGISPRARRILDWIEESGNPPPRFILTIYAPEPVGPVRLEREEIDFSPLGERKLAHSLDNFLCLADLLIESFPDLINRERVRGFLERLDPAEILYFKEEEGQNFDRWIQVWIRLQDAMERGAAGMPLSEERS